MATTRDTLRSKLATEGVSLETALIEVVSAHDDKLIKLVSTPAAAITAPNEQGVGYVQADVESIGDAVDAIIVALKNAGITL